MRSTGVWIQAAAMLVGAAAATPACGQSGGAFQAFEARCASIGGTSNHNASNPVCTPPTGAAGDPPGGYSSDQQAMLNLAGQFGSTLGAAIRESFQRAARQRQINEIQEAYERDQARVRAAQEFEQQKQHNEQLLASMHATIRAPELGGGRTSSEQLRLRSADEMFNKPGGARGTVTQEIPTGQVDLDELKRINDSYFLAMDDANAADADVRQFQTNVEAEAGLLREAQAYVDHDRLVLAGTPPGAPGRAAAEARLAESEALKQDVLASKAEQEAKLKEAQADAAERRRIFNDVQQRRYLLVRTQSAGPPAK
ncbi:MAG: hypothetical protein AB7M12_01325 [Hyphomonadaceae bacterium]